ncbi:3909_t:CDS:10 [Entrophospora sp. SA101]|nr:53_t:CDS:10 [Entrophospora sp. SA101]CAJ0754074.1 3909_t:CDS:10 [Entrophospora sp. SA101]CAJ0877654.1 3942_t:CDS:10 [Entrophospora sp. SA101]
MDRQTYTQKRNATGHHAKTNTDEHIFSSSLDDYEIHKNRPIGYGASAVVYSALYKPLNKKVAVKIIDLDYFERNQIDEVRRETQLMSLSKHQNVLRVYCSFVNESKLYIITPYMSAGSCSDIMKSSYPEGLEETIIATILKQALQGLDYLHRNGHIHRDVKAGNLLVDEDGSVLLADFGVASSLTENGERKGLRKTFPCWMAPEVMEHEGGYDYKADIWSFGITSLELATGHAPFAKYPPLKVIMVTLSNDPPTLERDSTKHKYSKSFKEMIDSCLQKDPTKRPSAEKLLSHSFFRQAKKKEYLYSKLLQSLPPLEDRPHKRVQQKPISYTKGVTWDFAIDSEYRNEDTLIETEDMKVKQDKKAVKFTMQSEESEIDNSTNTLPKKSRFSVEGQPQSEEIIKGRFSIIESNSSKEKSTPINLPTESDSNGQKISSVQEQSNESLSVIPSTNTPNESLLQLPSSLSRDSSLQSDSSSIEEISQVKNNRFQSGSSINTESPTIKNTEKIVGTKKGRFEVSN